MPRTHPSSWPAAERSNFAGKLTPRTVQVAAETGAAIADPRKVVPFVQEAVFLHHDHFASELSPVSAIGLYGLDGKGGKSHLPGISQLILEQPHRESIGANREQILVKLMDHIGRVQRRTREAGSWVIEDQALAEGEVWQEWLASYKVAQQGRARIRFRVTPAGARRASVTATARSPTTSSGPCPASSTTVYSGHATSSTQSSASAWCMTTTSPGSGSICGWATRREAFR